MTVGAVERQRPVLSRDTIVEAALQITLEQPLAPLTLARLGAELGADPTAIYRHFRNRDELLLDVADRIFGEAIAAMKPHDDWELELRDAAISLRSAMLRRPSLSAEVGSRFTGGVNERTGIVRLIDTFRRAGFDDGAALLHARTFGALLLATIVASAAALANSPEAHDQDMSVVRSVFGPRHVTNAADYEEATFALMLRTHLAGLRALLAADLTSDHDTHPGGTR